mmetsp:Transcript_4208/g.11100  ORF Transcript_4208/g.11100 Transcript_4208/m.11100 type:complete len:106 (-) Transcript_4208:1-318(-)
MAGAIGSAAGADGLVCELTLTFTSGAQRSFVLQDGGVIRVGRKASSDVVLDFEGVSAQHVELLLQRSGDEPLEDPKLCVRDSSRNGTAIRPSPAGPPDEEQVQVA